MNFMKFLRKQTVFSILVCILVLSSACSREIDDELPIVPINPLFNLSDIDSLSLHGGNIYYNNFLSSDGTSIYYQSVDGKSLMKSQYDGDKPVVLSNRFPSYINISGNTVFFIEGASSGKIYKVDTEGNGEAIVLDVNAKSLIVSSGYIFYIDTKDGFVYSILYDGSKKTLLFDRITSQILLVKDNIYFQPAELSKGIYTLSIENLNKSSNTYIPLTSSISASDSVLSSSAASSSGSGTESAASSKSPSVTPVPAITNPARSEITFIELAKANNELKSMNIEKSIYYYIDSSNNSILNVNETRSTNILLKAPVLSPFIVSEQYLYYINTADQSRLYRISLLDYSSNEMVVNDHVDQFVICGHSIYYRRQSKSDIFLTPIKGGISDKIT